jgi:hypothetical protein
MSWLSRIVNDFVARTWRTTSTTSCGSPRDFTFGVPGAIAEKARGQYASGAMFSELGLAPAVGRLLLPGDETPPGARLVAVRYE